MRNRFKSVPSSTTFRRGSGINGGSQNRRAESHASFHDGALPAVRLEITFSKEEIRGLRSPLARRLQSLRMQRLRSRLRNLRLDQKWNQEWNQRRSQKLSQPPKPNPLPRRKLARVKTRGSSAQRKDARSFSETTVVVGNVNTRASHVAQSFRQRWTISCPFGLVERTISKTFKCFARSIIRKNIEERAGDQKVGKRNFIGTELANPTEG
jgi:hypothetical protein